MLSADLYKWKIKKKIIRNQTKFKIRMFHFYEQDEDDKKK